MNTKNDFFEDIQDYRAGRLSAVEEMRFQAEYEKNPELRKAYQEYETISEALRQKEKKAFLAKMSYGETGQKKAKVRHLRPRFLLQIAAAAIILVFCWVFITGKGTESEQLFANNYAPPTTEGVVYIIENSEIRGLAGTSLDVEEINNLFSSATKNYQKGNLAEATTAYRQIIVAEKEYQGEKVMVAAKFYLADILLRSESPADNQEALALLEQIKGKRIYEKISREHIQWHIALAFVKNNQTESAIEILTEIVNKPKYDKFILGERSIRQRAETLLNELK